MTATKYFQLEAGLGDERDWMGNTVRPVLVEAVSQQWRAGEIVAETRTVRDTGKVALVVPVGGF